jgi:O-antigen/teichoic acid export membrane protein
MLKKILIILSQLRQHRSTFSNAGWLVSERVLDIAVTTIINVAVIAHLGPGPYGMFSYVVALASVFTIASTLGLDELIVTEIAKNRATAGQILQTALIVRGLASIFMMSAMTLFLLSQSHQKDFDTLLYFILLQPLLAALNLAPLWFRANMKAFYTFRVRTVVVLMACSAKLIGIYYDAAIGFFAIVAVSEMILGCSLMWGSALLSGLGGLCIRPDLSTVKSLFKRSLPLCLALLAGGLYLNMPILLTYHILGPIENGVFSAAHKIITMGYALPALLVNSFLPLVMAHAVKDSSGAMQKLRLILTLSFWSSAVIALIAIILAPYILPIFLGVQYSKSVTPLQIIALTIPLVALGSGAVGWIIHRKGEWLLLAQTLSGLVASLLIGPPLILKFGVTGAAISQLISFLASIAVLPMLGRLGKEILRIQLAAFLNRSVRSN